MSNASSKRSVMTLFSNKNDIYCHQVKIVLAEKGTEVEREEALKQLKEELLAVSVIFQQTPYFMSEEFGLVDCYVAPLLWKLRNMGVEFSGTGSKAIKGYMDRVFSRDSFLQSVGEAAPKNLMDDK